MFAFNPSTTSFCTSKTKPIWNNFLKTTSLHGVQRISWYYLISDRKRISNNLCCFTRAYVDGPILARHGTDGSLLWAIDIIGCWAHWWQIFWPKPIDGPICRPVLQSGSPRGLSGDSLSSKVYCFVLLYYWDEKWSALRVD